MEDIKRGGYSILSSGYRVWIKDGQTISEAVHSFKGFAETSDDAINDSEVIEMLHNAVQVIYYLSASNCVVKKVKKDKKNIIKTGKKSISLKIWDVGYRVSTRFPNSGVSLISECEDFSFDGSDKENVRNRPRPHIRRAHWHHYWVGEGRTKLELRWIAPTYVKGDSDSVVPTGHKVTS